MLPVEGIPTLLGELEAIRSRLWARLLSHQASPSPDAQLSAPDRLLSPQDAAALLGVTPKWLHRNRDQLPFTRLSRKVIRFKQSELTRWVAKQQHGRWGARFSRLEP